MNYLALTKSKIENFKKTSEKEKELALKELKILMLQFTSLPPSQNTPIQEEFELALQIIELEMEYSLQKKDEKAFELAYLKAKQFYFEFEGKIIKKKSEKKFYFIGLYLLYLLSNNKTTDFSTEVELLSKEDLSNAHIKISRDLEQSIMEGNYTAITQMKPLSDHFYNFFLSKFDDAIRYQIARSAEKSYESLKISDALQILMLSGETELGNFIREQEKLEDREINWVISGDRIVFIPLEKEKESIPAFSIVADALRLGIEMEKII